MRVLIACEFSGIVRDAFIRAGHDAVSCDLLPTESPGPHIQGDVTPVLRQPWDMLIAHPPCTYLANSGVHWLHRQQGRWEKMIEAARFFRLCMDANASLIAVENPVMHGYAKNQGIGNPDFTCQPWQFGDPIKKRVCWWLKGLPPLFPTQIVSPTRDIMSEPPHPDRAKRRSVFFPGMAEAMANQWT